MENYFKELVLSRQSCREFNDKPLEKSLVMDIVNLATLSPSACNSQPWKMYVVTDPDGLKNTAAALGVNGHNKFLCGAKAFVVLAEKQAVLKPGVRFDRNHFVKYDIGELLAYITLGAQSVGVSSCIIGMVDQELITSAVGLEDGEVCNVAVALGYSDISVREKKRKTVDETIKEL